MVSRIVCLMMLAGVACGATWMRRLPAIPQEHSHKEGCYIQEIDDVIPFGDMVTPTGICYRIECDERIISYASCGFVSIGDSPNCYLTETDVSRPYPDCCPDIKCEQDNYLI